MVDGLGDAAQVGDVQRDRRRRRRQGGQPARGAPAREVPPVAAVGAHGVGRLGSRDVAAGFVHQRAQFGGLVGDLSKPRNTLLLSK